MRCFSCGADATVLNVEPQTFANVRSGFELLTVKCPACGLTEKRLAPRRAAEPGEAKAAAPSVEAVLGPIGRIDAAARPADIYRHVPAGRKARGYWQTPARVPEPVSAPVRELAPAREQVSARLPAPILPRIPDPVAQPRRSEPSETLPKAPPVMAAIAPEAPETPVIETPAAKADRPSAFDRADDSARRFMQMVESVFTDDSHVPPPGQTASPPITVDQSPAPESPVGELAAAQQPPARDRLQEDQSAQPSRGQELVAAEKPREADEKKAAPSANPEDEKDKAQLRSLFSRLKISLRRA